MIEEWTKDYKDFLTWVRLNVAVSLCSNLEIYLGMVVARALESDPGSSLGASHAVDGIVLLKQREAYSWTKQAAVVVEGDWTKRLRLYEGYFGTSPDALRNYIAELDELRKLRNGVAHTFGRELDAYRSGLIVNPKALQPLSEDRLKKWFGMVEETAHAIDDHLRDTHIGEYEAILYFHSWRSTYKRDLTPIARSYKKAFGTFLQTPVSKRFCEDLIRHYDDA